MPPKRRKALHLMRHQGIGPRSGAGTGLTVRRDEYRPGVLVLLLPLNHTVYWHSLVFLFPQAADAHRAGPVELECSIRTVITYTTSYMFIRRRIDDEHSYHPTIANITTYSHTWS